MGLFLSLSGVIGSSQDAVIPAIADYAALNGGEFFEAGQDVAEEFEMEISEDWNGQIIRYPYSFFNWDDASQYLSDKLQTSVFSFHIHDGDLWMYVLYRNGREVDQFNPITGYWNEVDASEAARWKGNPHIVAEATTISADKFMNYLRFWQLQETGKAYPDDEFTFGEDWQLVDFMRRLGLSYPEAFDRKFHFEVATEE